jgi:hypothetical protein
MMRRRKGSGQRADEMGSEQVPLLVYSRTDEAFLLPRCRVYRRSSGMWGGTPPALPGSLFVDSCPFESTNSCVNVIDMSLGDGYHILSIRISRLQAYICCYCSSTRSMAVYGVRSICSSGASPVLRKRLASM